MSFTEEEFRARYGTQQIDSDEDDELLGYKSDDVIVTSSGHHGDHASPSDLDYQYEQELDYEEVEDIDPGEFDNTDKAQVRISLHELSRVQWNRYVIKDTLSLGPVTVVLNREESFSLKIHQEYRKLIVWGKGNYPLYHVLI